MKDYRIGKIEFKITNDHKSNPIGSLGENDAFAREVFCNTVSKANNHNKSLPTKSLLDLTINEITIHNYQLLEIKERNQFKANTGTSIECPIELIWTEVDDNDNANLKKIDIARARLSNVIEEKRYNDSYCKYTNCSLHIPAYTDITVESLDDDDEDI